MYTETVVEHRASETERRRQALADEHALDNALADSFPASDPPSWTSGIARPRPRGSKADAVVNAVRPERDHRGAWHVTEEALDGSVRVSDRPFAAHLISLAGGVGIALLVPGVILLVGIPVVLAVRGVVQAISWLRVLIFP